MTGFLILAFLILVAGVLAVPLATRLGLGSVLGYLLAGMAISPLLADQPWQTALAVGMVLALSSTAIIVQTLTEKGLLRTEGGEASFSVLLVQDVAVIPILALVPLLALPELAGAAADHTGGGAHAGIDFTAHMSGWLAAGTRIGAVAAVIAIGIFAIRPLFRYIARANLRELFTAAALLVVIGIALLMSLVGLSPALGAFIAGVVLATSEYRHELESDINPFKGLLLGLFFITVGAGIDFALASTIWDSVLFWAAVTIAAKMAVLLVVGWLYGLRHQALWLFCLSLPQAGEFAFVLIAFGVANAVFEPAFADQLLLIVALTMLVTPLLFILYDKLIAHAYSTGQGGREADAIDEDNPIIIAGRGRVGGIVDRMLDAAGHRATVIDYNSEHLEVLKKFGVTTYYGDATRPDLLASAGIDRARILVVALDEREQIDRLVRYACANFPGLHVVARAKDRDHVYHLWAMGCRDIVRETYDSSLRMGRSVYEALGHDRQSATAMVEAWEEMDRTSMREIADVFRLDTPSYENEELLAKIRELKAEWDPKLREAMDEIAARGR